MTGNEARKSKAISFLRSPRFKLYSSYALSTWSDRSWSFAVSLALYEVGGDLFLPALSNLLNSLTVILLGVVIGKWIDRAPRLQAARWSLMGNNASVAGSGACLVLALWDAGDIKAASTSLYWALVVGAVLLCAAASLAGAATKIVITKDWVTVVAQGDKEALAALNATMVLIDHVCGILAPLLAGQIMTSVDIAAGCLFVAAWNVVSFPVEYGLLSLVFHSLPDLALPRSHSQPPPIALVGSPVIAEAQEKDRVEDSSATLLAPAPNDAVPAELPSDQIEVMLDKLYLGLATTNPWGELTPLRSYQFQECLIMLSQ